jgi:cysteine desulfurase/selenocysteine lyase
MDAIHEHEQEIVAYAFERLSEMPGLRILGPGPTLRGGVISFWMDDAHPHDISAILSEDGICVRAGHHCAQPLHDRFRIPASARASFYIYNDKDDVDALVAALHKVVRLLGRR